MPLQLLANNNNNKKKLRVIMTAVVVFPDGREPITALLVTSDRQTLQPQVQKIFDLNPQSVCQQSVTCCAFYLLHIRPSRHWLL